MIWVGLPAYNEAERIVHLLENIDKSLSRENKDYKIIVYDDGSSDDTVSKVLSVSERGIKAELIKGVENKGLGYALSYLLEHCIDKASLEDVIITMDADATHNPEHIHRMLSYIKDGFDVVIASRYTPYSRIRGLSFCRQVLSNIGNLIFRLLFPIKGVKDYSCAYRAYSAKTLKLAKDIYKAELIKEHGFSCMAELLIKLRQLDIIACEVPLILRYDRKFGSSKMNIPANILKTLKMILKLLFSGKAPFKGLQEHKKRYNL